MAGPVHCTPILASCRERCRHGTGERYGEIAGRFVVISPSSFFLECGCFFEIPTMKIHSLEVKIIEIGHENVEKLVISTVVSRES